MGELVRLVDSIVGMRRNCLAGTGRSRESAGFHPARGGDRRCAEARRPDRIEDPRDGRRGDRSGAPDHRNRAMKLSNSCSRPSAPSPTRRWMCRAAARSAPGVRTQRSGKVVGITRHDGPGDSFPCSPDDFVHAAKRSPHRRDFPHANWERVECAGRGGVTSRGSMSTRSSRMRRTPCSRA